MPSLVWLLIKGIAMLLTVPCKGQRCEIPKRNSLFFPKTGTCIYKGRGRIYYNFFIKKLFQPFRGVLLGILGGGVQPGSPNPNLISDQNCHFSDLRSDLASKNLWRRYLD